MLSFIENVYYRFYRLSIYLGEESIHRYNAVLIMSILSILNFVTILMILMVITRVIIIVDLPRIYLLVIGLAIIGINSYIVFHNKNYIKIEKRNHKLQL